MLAAVELTDKKPGVNFIFQQGTAEATRGETKTIALNQFAKTADLKQPFKATFDGYINVPSDGVYEFQTDATWTAAIVIDGQDIINYEGNKDRKVTSAVVPLKAGLHKIQLGYNHGGGDAAFRIRWGVKGQGLRGVGGNELVH